MARRSATWIALALCAGLLASPARAQDDEGLGFERTPPRLSFTDGEVSFLRPGAEEWTTARVNTPLAAGDELYTAEDANLELQIGARAFVRAGENTQLGLTSLEPDFLQLRVATGHVSLDLRSLKAGQTLELDTPNAAFTVERSGYYRVEVDGETTTFTSRRGGRATVTPAAGDSGAIAASEQVVVTGIDTPQVETYAAPELDAWDRWNYARTDDQIDAVSARYVPSDVYGADDLDHHGDWRLVPTYGAVWVPRHVAVGWAPYSTGRWLFDPYYGWTWVDDAPWGWAPYHYGRWVHVSGYWGWCPGPVVARAYYAPALVAFFGGGGFSVGITIGTPHVGWVALGWGEPVVPWWGPPHFRGRPRWAGWSGPRIVNNVVVEHEKVIHVKEINVYQNTHVRDAIVTVDRDHFGRRSDRKAHFTRAQAGKLEPLHGDPGVKPDRTSVVADIGSAKRPPREARQRAVVATREPRVGPAPLLESRRVPKAKREQKGAPGAESGAADVTPPARVVQPPREGKRVQTSKRPPFGESEAERRMPPPAPRFEKREAAREPRPPRPEERVAGARPERAEAPGRREKASPPPRELPGEPANRVYRQREERRGSISHEAEHSRPEGGESGPKQRDRSRGR